MRRIRVAQALLKSLLSLVVVIGLAAAGVSADMMDGHASRPFTGVKANTGTVSFNKANGRIVLTLSDDFVVPDTPDPHWQVVDSKGTVYQLDRLKAKNDKYNKSITLPSYIHDVAKVQIWCAFAEVLLGEAPFDKPMM